MGAEAEFKDDEQDTGVVRLADLAKELDSPDEEGDLKEGELSTDKVEDSDDDKDDSKADDQDDKSDADDDDSKDDKSDEDDDKDDKDDEGDDEPDPRDIEIRNLKKANQSQEEDLRELRAEQRKTQKMLLDSGLIKEEDLEGEDDEVDPLVEATRIKLETLVETMKLNPNYADLDDVVSEERYNDTISGAVQTLVDDKGYSKDDAFDAVNQFIWTKPNPYKYLYDVVKKTHPDFYVEDKVEDKDDKGKKKKDDERNKKKEVAASLNDIPGGGDKDEKGGWTTAKIDSIPEDKLDAANIPQAIYDKYMAGELK